MPAYSTDEGKRRLALRRINGVLVAGLWALCLAGCANDPNPVGLGILPKTDSPLITTDTLYATAHATSRALILTMHGDGRVYSWIADRLMVGKTQNIEANAFMMFSSIPDTLIGASITSATVQLKSVYSFGDPLAPVAFTAYRALASWRGDSLSYDSLTQRPSDYYSPIPVSQTISQSVLDTTSLQFSIDTAMVRQWFSVAIDSGNINQGIILRPSNGAVIKGFASDNAIDLNARPKLIVTYVNKNGVPGTYTDSIGFSKYIAFISSPNLVQDPSLMYVQAGVSYRGSIDFDISTLPNPSVIHRAELELTLNAAGSSSNNYTRDSLFAFFVTDDGLITTTSATLSSKTTSTGSPIYSFSLGSYVQRWERTGTLRRIAVGAFGENDTFDRFAFQGSSSALAIKPRLIVTYSPAR